MLNAIKKATKKFPINGFDFKYLEYQFNRREATIKIKITGGFLMIKDKIAPNKIPIVLIKKYNFFAVLTDKNLPIIIESGLFIISVSISYMSLIIYPATVINMMESQNNMNCVVFRLVTTFKLENNKNLIKKNT